MNDQSRYYMNKTTSDRSQKGVVHFKSRKHRPCKIRQTEQVTTNLKQRIVYVYTTLLFLLVEFQHLQQLSSALLVNQIYKTSSTPRYYCNIMTQRHNHQLRHRLTTAKLKDDDDSIDCNSTDDITASSSAATFTTSSGNYNRKELIEHNLLVKRNLQLQQENDRLQQSIQHLMNQQQTKIVSNSTTKQHHLNHENRYHTTQLMEVSQRPIIVALERFEGGSGVLHHNQTQNIKLDKNSNINKRSYKKVSNDIEHGDISKNISGGVVVTNNIENDDSTLWCDEIDVYDGTCPIEPNIQFIEALRDRATWLIGLLVVQSISGIILARNELLLQNHPSIIYFLTMLVGAGGNAGNQASVRVIRGIAIGVLQPKNYKVQIQFLFRELKMAFFLSIILSIIGFLRTILFSTTRTPLPEAIAITVALYMIVFTSICLGAILPFVLQRIKIDPAHSSTSIQVIMDILGVFLTVAVTSILLDSPFGKAITSYFM